MIIRPLLTALKNFFRNPVTIKYPEETRIITERERGLHWLVTDKCTGCSMCFQVCPSKAITMIKAESGTKLSKINRRGILPVIDYNKCIFCGLCVDVCAFNALHMSPRLIVVADSPEGFKPNIDKLFVTSEDFERVKREEYEKIKKNMRDLG